MGSKAIWTGLFFLFCTNFSKLDTQQNFAKLSNMPYIFGLWLALIPNKYLNKRQKSIQILKFYFAIWSQSGCLIHTICRGAYWIGALGRVVNSVRLGAHRASVLLSKSSGSLKNFLMNSSQNSDVGILFVLYIRT